MALTSIRPRRFIFFISLTCLGLYFVLPSSIWRLPGALKDIEGLSRANIVPLVKSPPAIVDEIYGLIHLVTGDAENEHVLVHQSGLDPTQPVDMGIYAVGQNDVDWPEVQKQLNLLFPVVVFSKSYCPFSKKAKSLLDSYDLIPKPKIIEVDLRDDAIQLKILLTRLTQHSTFPNILVHGNSIGGSDELHALHSNKTLRKIFENAGVTVGASGV